MANAKDQLTTLVRDAMTTRIRERGLTKSAVADAAGIGPEYLSRILSGRQRVHCDLARELLAVVGARLTIAIDDIEEPAEAAS